MANKDYQLEELENAAVNKSNNAKRIAAAAGLLAAGGAAGGAAGFAATNIPLGTVEEPMEQLAEEDFEGIAETGAAQVSEPQPQPQPQPQYQATPEPAPEPEPEVDVNFNTTTHYYDEDNNLIATTEEGTVDGHKFTLLDVDGDNQADIFAYDENNNGAYEENEIVTLQGDNQIAMGHQATEHKDVFIASNDPAPDPEPEPYDIEDEKDYADNDVHNDFEDEKTGEDYSHDYAENNDDYNNGNEDNYYAENSNDAYDAYEDEAKDDGDYGYDGLAENNTTDDTFDDLGSDSLDIV